MRSTFAAAVVALSVGVAPAALAQVSRPGPFTVNQVRSYPFPNELAAAATGSRVAWAFNEQGRRNIFVAEGPAFSARQLTHYDRDDGQELSSVAVSANGKWVVYVRGGDHGSNWDDGLPVNVGSNPVAPKVQIFSVPFDGGDAKAIADGDEPVISPRSDVGAFIKGGQIWTAPIDGSAPAKQLFTARREVREPRRPPDGSRLAFVVYRVDHSLVGVFANDSTAITWLAPAFARDRSPRWSPDGKRIAFVRLPGAGGAPDALLPPRPNPWEIWTGDAATGAAQRLWKSPETLAGSVPSTDGGTNLGWGAGDRIVFLSYQDGWPHLYSVPAAGGTALLLTPGRYMAEHISLSADGRWQVFAGNMGADSLDIDRRHVVRGPGDRAAPQVRTPGTGLEWSPAITGDGTTLVFISATPQRPPLPAAVALDASRAAIRPIGADHVPAGFPTALVPTKQVVFRSADGLTIHGQLFEASGGGNARKPAIVYVHGGPPRQMLLGWHYSDYYSNAYALNQYLASRGFIVLSVNYRLGIGYGHDFHRPPNAGAQGASEYLDVKAGAEYLQRLNQVDAKRIGIYGGSYGGFLTALALARDSKLFAAGVDIHGVHNWTAERAAGLLENRYEKIPDVQQALDVAWQSSPVSAIASWKSPVLLIHGDDDRNVRFNQTTDLVRRLEKAGVTYEEMVIPDDTHHFMRYANQLRVNAAVAAFFDRVFGMNRQSNK